MGGEGLRGVIRLKFLTSSGQSPRDYPSLRTHQVRDRRRNQGSVRVIRPTIDAEELT